MAKQRYQVEIIGRTGYVTDTTTGHVYSCPLLNGPKKTKKFMASKPDDEAICATFDFC